MTKNTYSITIISKGRRAVLERCFEKLKEYRVPCQIICVEATDDPPPKDIEGIDYVAIPADQGGFSKQRNLSIEQSTGDYIIFVDDDCEITADWYERIIEPIETNPDVIGVLGAVYPLKPSMIGFCEGVLGHPSGGFKIHARSKGQYVPLSQVSTCNSIMKKEAIDSVGGFDLLNVFGSEDTDLVIRITDKYGPNRFRYTPHALVFHQPRNVLNKFMPWYIRRGKSDAALFLKHTTHLDYLLKTSISVKILPVILLSVFLQQYWIMPVVFMLWYALQLRRNAFMWNYFDVYGFPLWKRWMTYLSFPFLKIIADTFFDIGRVIGVFEFYGK